MIGNPEHEQIRRMVIAMEDVADAYADQNLWDLARRAWASIQDTKREEKVTSLAAAYGATADQQRRLIAESGISPTGRMQVAPVPLTFSTDPAQGYQPPDYAAQLGEIERLFAAKCPSIGGENTVRKVDALIQDHQSATQRAEHAEKLLRDLAHKVSPKNPITAEQVMGAVQGLMANHQAALQEIEQLRGKVTELAGFKDRLTQSENELQDIRGALDPDGQFEDESLIVLARERMNQRAARGQELDELRRERTE